MTRQTIDRIVDWIDKQAVERVDLTGGAPELNPNFRYLGDALAVRQTIITSRCNLTVLFEPGQTDLAHWYADRHVRLVCSLPCYSKVTVDTQRGRGVFDKSLRGLTVLNEIGYGWDDSLQLDLVYNPAGTSLPAAQKELEQLYRDQLYRNYGVVFNNLLTLTNLPINRFAHQLHRSGRFDEYIDMLDENFNAATVDQLMCRHALSVDWQGRIYDCDFNQMAGVPFGDKEPLYLWDMTPESLDGAVVAVRDYCLSCTAGAGSSCGGALVQ